LFYFFLIQRNYVPAPSSLLFFSFFTGFHLTMLPGRISQPFAEVSQILVCRRLLLSIFLFSSAFWPLSILFLSVGQVRESFVFFRDVLGTSSLEVQAASPLRISSPPFLFTLRAAASFSSLLAVFCLMLITTCSGWIREEWTANPSIESSRPPFFLPDLRTYSFFGCVVFPPLLCSCETCAGRSAGPFFGVAPGVGRFLCF